MTQSEARGPYGWKAWRIKRLLEILQHKAMGLTDKQAAEKMPISQATVSRELNSPQAADIGRELRRRAEGLVMPLVEKQLRQIEGDKSLTPGQKLIYRGKIIDTLARLAPRQIEQKISADFEGTVKMIDVSEEDLLLVIAPVVDELLARRAKGADSALPEEDTEEPVG